MQVAMDSMVGNAYLYGRKWLASKVLYLSCSTKGRLYGNFVTMNIKKIQEREFD